MIEYSDISELTKAHFNNLKNLASDCKLNEYFDYLHNSNDSREHQKLEDIKKHRLKVNEKVIEQQQSNKVYEINWNLDYCEKCKLSYWPYNCTVYIVPKYHMNIDHARINRKIKLFDFKPKLNSYKDKVIKNAINRGIELVYECKRCRFKNIIVDELKRQNLKCLKSTKTLNEIKFKQDFKKSALKFNNRSQIENSQVEKPVTVTSNAVKKKFQSLQLKLKQNEMEQEKLKTKTNSSFGSLSDFLEKLSK